MKSISDLLRDKQSLLKIPYKISEYSSYASSYTPNNILIDTPTDVNLRWSTTTNDHRQFLILEYDCSIVSTITFGKFSKIHVCNIKEMKISVSFDKQIWTEVFYGGLKNDIIYETHNLLYYKNGYIISKYMKIEPLAAWGMNFNYSIWFVELKGVTDSYFEEIIKERQLTEDIRKYKNICKKYNKDILDKEDKIEYLVKNNMFDELEEYIKNVDKSVFDGFVNKSKYSGTWTELPKDEKEDWPCPRGGHQMVCTDEAIFLYGGWDGIEELGDMWMYNGKWECIHKDIKRDYNINNIDKIIDSDIYSHKTVYGCIEDNLTINLKNNTDDVITNISENYNPGRRSCHKMCTDGSKLFLTGRYIPTTDRSGDNDDSELWVYDKGWSIYKNTGDVSSNMYDHYLVYANNGIYMFGGKTTNFDDAFGGLYRISVDHSISTANWNKLIDSSNQATCFPNLKGRLGHVLLHIDIPEYPNTLAVVGGQKGKEYFKCITLYSLDTATTYESIPFPIQTDGRVIQRSILYNQDILVLFTYGKDKDSRLDISKLYSYNLIYREWKEIEVDCNGPMPRTAHQLIYWKDIFYLFGGNVVDTRQSDLWTLSLKKLTHDEVRRLAVMTVRKHKFIIMYNKNSSEGLKYLRSRVLECVVDKNTKKIFEDTCYEIFNRQSDPYDDISQFLNK